MDPRLVSIGIAMGLAIAMPLGPANIIVIRSALKRGLFGGLAAGLGAVFADTLFAVVAAFGISSVEHLLLDNAKIFTIIGGLFLVVLGIHTARSKITPLALQEAEPQQTAAQAGRAAALTFTTTITNPGALLGVFAVFGAMGAALELATSTARAMNAVVGFAIGGILWWMFLSFLVSKLKSRITDKTLSLINRWTGVLIAGFGFALLMQLF